MRMVMIASIYKDDSRIGFRILDADSINDGKGQLIDTTDDKICAVLSSNKIENLEIKNKMLKGSNGDISRYGKIVNGVPGQQTSPLVILTQIGEVGYLVCDCLGQVRRLRVDELIKLAGVYGIANGKLMTRDNKQYISAISGQYHYTPYKQSEVEKPVQTVKVETNPTIPKNANTEDKGSSKLATATKPKEYALAFSEEQIYVLQKYYEGIELDESKKDAEIEYLNDVVKNNKQSSEYKKYLLLNEIIAKVGTGIKLSNIFGLEIANSLAQFITVNLPLPKSLIALCYKYIHSHGGARVLFIKLFPEFEDCITVIFKAEEDTFRVVARDYLEYIVNTGIVGEYAGIKTQSDIDALELASKYALTNSVSLNDIRALLGATHLLEEYSSILLYSVRSSYDFRNEQGKIHYAAMHYNAKHLASDITIGQAILNLTTYTPELGDIKYDIPLYYSSNYSAVPRFLDRPISKKHPKCSFYSTPQAYTNDIKEVYAGLLKMMRYGEERAITEFLVEAKKFILDKREAEREESRRATEELARKSLARQEELRKQREAERQKEAERQAEEKRRQAKIQHDALYKSGTTQKPVASAGGTSGIRPNNNLNTVGSPESQKISSTGKTQLQIDIEAGADLSKYDPIDLYNELKKNMTGEMTDSCYVISNDMIARNMAYRDMSNRQRYRLNEAINKMMQAIYGKKNKKSVSSDETKPVPNNKYNLSEHPEISSKVNKLIEKANSVEMTAILSREPNVLKICYSILRYGTASDKQLARVDNAIKILEEQ